MAESKVNVSLSPEQAALLMPLLEQLSGSSTPHRTNTNHPRQCQTLRYSTPPLSPSTNVSSSECQYSTDDLLERKKKNSKSTPAQNYLVVSLTFNLHCVYRTGTGTQDLVLGVPATILYSYRSQPPKGAGIYSYTNSHYLILSARWLVRLVAGGWVSVIGW